MRRYRGWYLLPLIPFLLATGTVILYRGFLPPEEEIQASTPAPAPVKVICRLCERFQPNITGIFGKIDRAGKGYVTMADVDRAILGDHTIKGEDAAALFALRQNFSALAVRGIDGELQVGPKQLKDFHEILPAGTAQSIDTDMFNATEFLKKVRRDLYASGTPAESLSKMRVLHQLNRGNCYLLSGIGSLAVIDPELVRSMITDNGVDARGVRSYTVRFLRAPDEQYVVEELTDAALLLNDVEEDSGIWASVMVRAYGMYQMRHPYVRFFQRWFFALDKKILPEDLTNEGSMSNDGLKMMSPPGTELRRVVWQFDQSTIKGHVGDVLVQGMEWLRSGAYKQIPKKVLEATPWLQDVLDLARLTDDPIAKAYINFYLRGMVADQIADWIQLGMSALLYQERDAGVTHAQLKKSICDQRLPATVFKYGGQHEASIIAYTPVHISADGQHKSAYGFVTIRDQSGLSGEEQAKIAAGLWWREPGADEETVSMSVEDFTAFYSGFSSAIRRKEKR